MGHATAQPPRASARPGPSFVPLPAATPKAVRDGTHRALAPAQTLERVRPVARAIGLTRFADITHLDRVGIPVVLAVRPNGGWLSVDAGKGLTLTHATVSAAMECIERHHAETAQLDVFEATWAQLHAAGEAPGRDGLGLARATLFDPDRPQRWAWSWDVVGGRPLAVPAATLGAQPRRGRWDGDPLDFQVTSNGLASGNVPAEALCSGLCEVIERDAVACWGRRERRRGGAFTRVDPAALEGAAAQALLAQLHDADLDALVFDFTSDIRVPTYAAYLFDRRARHGGYFRGFGTHLDPQVAVARALTEAAQCRTIMVAGSRDDVFWAELVRTRRRDDPARYAQLRDIAPVAGAGVYEDASTATLDGDLAVLLDRLAEVGLEQVGVVDLSRAGEPLAVARVVVPGLEGYETTTFYAPGPRARAFAGR